MTCTYNAPAQYILPELCPLFQSFGCCFANQISMLAQNQYNDSNVQFFPPCLMRYLSINCPSLNSTSFCVSGANANMTVVLSGRVTIRKCFGGTCFAPGIPNVYSNLQPIQTPQPVLNTFSGILSLQGIIAKALGLPGGSKGALNVQILNYAYYDIDGNLASNKTGLPLSPPTQDFTAANQFVDLTKQQGYGIYDFAVVMPGITDAEAAMYANKSGEILLALETQDTTAFGKIPFYGEKNVDIVFNPSDLPPPVMYLSDPFLTHKNSAMVTVNVGFNLVFLTCIISTVASLILMK